jgi:signal transduction histidine kinase
MVLFYALYSWRAFIERENFMRQLRPFVSTQHFVSHLFSDDKDAIQHSQRLFHAICSGVLGTERAHIIPIGALASLVGERLTYPPGEDHAPVQPPANLGTAAIAVEPGEHDGYCWAIPLWSERGLIGWLMIGRKQGNAVYTQEEIEIAQAGGERIIDMLAGEKMARALFDLQRKRLTQTRVIDLRTRRTLHDQVLPAIHATILELSSAAVEQPVLQDTQDLLSKAHQQIADLIRDIPGPSPDNSGRRELTAALRQIIDSEFKGAFSSIVWRVDVPLYAVSLEREIIAGAVREVVRNAAIHARGTAPDASINLTFAISRGDEVAIIVRDDGIGVSTTRPSASGSGLTLHSTLLALIGGSLQVTPADEGGTCALICLPSALFKHS